MSVPTDDPSLLPLLATVRALTALSTGEPLPGLPEHGSSAIRAVLDEIGELLTEIERERQRRELDQNLLEQAQNELQEQLTIIERQSAVISRLQAPVLELGRGILCVPVIGIIDAEQGAVLAENVLNAVGSRSAHCVILDITGLEEVDTATAGHFIATANGVRLLGARCMLTGVSPRVAQTFVHIGSDLQEIETCGSLGEAIERLNHDK